MAIPAKFGGPGNEDYRYHVVLQEEAARALVTMGTVRTRLDVILPYFLAYTDDEQQARWFPGLAAGELLTATAMTIFAESPQWPLLRQNSITLKLWPPIGAVAGSIRHHANEPSRAGHARGDGRYSRLAHPSGPGNQPPAWLVPAQVHVRARSYGPKRALGTPAADQGLAAYP